MKVNNIVQIEKSSTKADDGDDKFYDIYSLSMWIKPPLVVEATINSANIKMDVDTGASGIINQYGNIKHQIYLQILTAD